MAVDRAVAGVLLSLCLLATPACDEDRATPLAPASDRARTFVEAEGLPDVRWYADVLDDPARDLLLFRVEYGERHDTPVGPAYPTAFGLVVGERIGWVVPPEVLGARATTFDVLPRDAGILDVGFLEAVREASVRGYTPVRIMLAGDVDTPEETLVYIAGSLGHGTVEIGEALIENPIARGSYPVLSKLVRVTMLRSMWRDVNERAWSALEPLVASPGSLGVTAVFERPDLGQIRTLLTFRNATDRPFLSEYASMCALAVLVYDDPTYEGAPRWDGHRWQNTRPGACKWMPAVAELGVGESADLAARASDSIILGDSLAAGTYWLATRVRFLQPADTTLVIPAGEVELSR